MKVTHSYIKQLEFFLMPCDAGQMVEYTYACDESGVWECCYDRSDQSLSYRFAPYDARASEENLKFEPFSGVLPSHNKWQKVKVV